MDKIFISKISEEVHQLKGFDETGCYGCSCDDACCSYGADVDKLSYQLIIQYKDFIEPVIQEKIENCFEDSWLNDKEFLGEAAIRSKTKKGKCIFNLQEKKGCILFKLVFNDHFPPRLIPSICRLYPITWQHGQLEIYKLIEPQCNCLDIKNKSKSSIFMTQQKAIEDIFEIDKSCYL